jgi:hypothetical protein
MSNGAHPPETLLFYKKRLKKQPLKHAFFHASTYRQPISPKTHVAKHHQRRQLDYLFPLSSLSFQDNSKSARLDLNINNVQTILDLSFSRSGSTSPFHSI